MKKNLIKELDAQNLRIFSIENKRKQRDILMMEIVRKNKEITTAKRTKNI